MEQLAIILIWVIVLSACHNDGVPMRKSYADSIVNLAFTLDSTMSTVKHLQEIDRSENYFKGINDRCGLGKAAVKRAVLYFGAGQSDDALGQLDHAKAYLRDIDDLTLLTYYRAHAILLTEKNILSKEAESDMKHAIRLSMRNNNNYLAAVDMGNLAELYIRSQRFKDAKKILARLYPLTKGKPAGYLVQQNYCSGLISLHEGMTDKAYSDFQECYRNATIRKVPSLQISALKELSRIDSARHDYKAFSKHYCEYIRIRDNTMGRQTVEQINTMKAEHEMQNIEMKHHNERIFFYLLLALALVIVASLSVLAWMLVRRNQQNQQIARLTREQMENKVHTQNLEKELLELKLQKDQHRIETVQREKASMSVQLAAMENVSKGEGKQVRNYAQLLERLEPRFTERLEQVCPTISKAELRIASLIHLGMDASEMAQVLHISPSSLYTLRYRLRRRLALKADDSLENFINKLLES